jgi:hypothetical protein
MSWRQLTAANIQGRMTTSEQSLLKAAAGGPNKLQERLTDAVNQFVGAMAAAGYPVLKDGSVPDQIRNHVMAMAVWEWLKDFPQLKMFQTDQRKTAAADAEKVYEKICQRTYGAIESPFGTDTTTGNWNSQPRLIGRMEPVPTPVNQRLASPTQPFYANPNATTDAVPTNSPGVPQAPLGLAAQAAAGAINLTWLPVEGIGVTYTIYRGTSPNQQLLTPIATALTATNYTDAVAAGTAYFYVVAAVAGGLTSPQSNEVTSQAL